MNVLKTIFKDCRGCGDIFELTPEQQQKYIDKGQVFPENCPSCLKKKHKVAYATNCKDCNNGFEVTQYEVDRNARLGHKDPTHCPTCRRRRREEKRRG